MKYSIAIETSGRLGSAALIQDGQVVASRQFEHGLKHAAGLIPLIDQLLRESGRGAAPSDLKHLYVSVGPGSFTGLRIGVTLAKTLALATGVKVVAVPSARVLLENTPPQARHVVIVLDAKRGQIFTARFERVASSDGEVVIEREPPHLDTLATMVGRAPKPVWLIGEGIPFHEASLPADRSEIVITAPETWRLRAEAVALIGQQLSADGKFSDPDTLVPIYLRKPEAEEKLDGPGIHPPAIAPMT